MKQLIVAQGQVWKIKKERDQPFRLKELTIGSVRPDGDDIVFRSVEQPDDEYVVGLLHDNYEFTCTLDIKYLDNDHPDFLSFYG